MDSAEGFRKLDEEERVYAPEELPEGDPERARVRLDEGDRFTPFSTEPPAAAPVASVGNTPTGQAAPPNIGHQYHDGAPGDPETQARDPMEHMPPGDPETQGRYPREDLPPDDIIR